ncbi:MAG TPA: phenylalanine--tRNA ligase subunit alpha [candidate division WWE3 bacterium]|uniref:Phenylalanine--tRNA ligase alpha subunit n=1 Tax=candidate division WWE3 bacterium TaxID=2053526 RepID=A0A7C1HHE6_UNCKA|nr:phenylalanine--tRNA ligase subunit alpha [candidate division WWE3 bacterium]
MESSVNSDLNALKKQVETEVKAVLTVEEGDALWLKYFGKSGVVKKVASHMATLPAEERKDFGVKFNSLKAELEEKIQNRIKQLSQKEETPLEKFYKTLPGKKPQIGHLHIITQAIREIVEIFKPLGFTQVRYPEIDWDYYAFEALNMPETHPARDEWETFFVDAPDHAQLGKMVITPHTSNGQIREMLEGQLPIRMLNISRCGRRQSDLTHNPSFFQFEGLVVDKGINITHLKGVLDYFAKNFFGPDRTTRLRPYDFRFTEPSFEVDINCGLCKGEGCKFCKGGWLELGGAGMVHPNVFKACNVDPEKYTGFAFGWGVERTYMMKSGTKLDDIRLLLGNDLRFLEQF